MNNFWKCFWYLFTTGMLSFFIGRIIPKSWFDAEKAPFRACKFERDGRFYDIFKIRKWQNKALDMSKILPKTMPAKNLSGNFRERLPRMIQETCVAEMIHFFLCFTCLFCLKLYPGIGGVIIVTLYIVLNVPYIIIQRYNRPRLLKLLKRIEREEAEEKEEEIHAACEC